MYVHTPEAAAVRPVGRLAGPLAAMVIVAAVIALALPVSSPGQKAGVLDASAAALSDSHAATIPARLSWSVSADHRRVPLFFGYLEYDWDPDVPGGVPGFDSWATQDLRVVEASPRN